MKLRDYQTNCLSLIQDEFAIGNKTNKYIVMPTGTGKTEVFKNITNKKVLVLENSQDLRDQIASRFSDITDDAFTIGSGVHLTDALLQNKSKVIIATIQTLVKDLDNFDNNSFDLIIIDECHHTESDTRYVKILNKLNYKLCLGFTATPSKTSTVFGKDDKLYEMTIYEAWRDGWLEKPELHTLKLNWDKTKLTIPLTKQGVWRDDDIEKAFSSYTQENFELILNTLKELNNCEKSIVYFPTIYLSESFAEYCNKEGYKCFSLTSKTSRALRKEYLADFERTRNIIISNVLCLKEGINLPSMECMINTRPTKDINLYKQIVGRILRKAPGKKTCKVCDCIVEQNDKLFQHTFVTSFCLPQLEINIGIEKSLVKDISEQINATKNINEITDALQKDINLFYQLIKEDKEYCDTYEIPYYKEKNKIIGIGEVYEIKNNVYGNPCYDYSKKKYTIRFMIDTNTYLLKIYINDNTKQKHKIYFNSTEQCFAQLNNMYCKILNPFKKRYYHGNITKKQSDYACNLIKTSINSPELAKKLVETLSKREASEYISRLLCYNFFDKIEDEEEN